MQRLEEQMLWDKEYISHDKRCLGSNWLPFHHKQNMMPTACLHYWRRWVFFLGDGRGYKPNNLCNQIQNPISQNSLVFPTLRANSRYHRRKHQVFLIQFLHTHTIVIIIHKISFVITNNKFVYSLRKE